jgi:hypothetical protein
VADFIDITADASTYSMPHRMAVRDTALVRTDQVFGGSAKRASIDGRDFLFFQLFRCKKKNLTSRIQDDPSAPIFCYGSCPQRVRPRHAVSRYTPHATGA